MPERSDGAEIGAQLPELSNSKLVSPAQPLPPELPGDRGLTGQGLSPRAPQRPEPRPDQGQTGPAEQAPATAPPIQRFPRWLIVAVPLLLLAGVGAAAFLLNRADKASVDTSGKDIAANRTLTADNATTDADGSTTDNATVSADAETGSGTEAGTASETDPASPTASAGGLPVPVAPYLQAQLSQGQLQLTGIVPSEELKGTIDQSVAPAYLPAFASATTVDNSLPTPAWLAQSSTALTLLQNGLIDGTMLVSEGTVYVEGISPNQVAFDETIGFITDLTGMPVSAEGVEVQNLRGATYTLAASDGNLALSGSLPTEEMRLAVLAAAEQFYDPANIVEATTVDPGVAPALWMYNPEALVAVLAQFPDYEVRLKGDGFDVRLSGANTFESGSAQFTDSFIPVLNYGIVVMLRDPAVTMIIEGHTDDQGDEASNLALSQARADAVAAYIIGGGIDPARITATGKGETEPVADNATAQGRSINRRVEFGVSAPTS